MGKEKSGEELLLEAKAEVLKWRNDRSSQSRVPDYIWERALNLHKFYGIYRISQELGLHYEGLRKRSVERSSNLKTTERATFVELPITGVSAGVFECVIQLKDRGMEIQFKSPEAAALGVMVREMLRVER